MSEYQKIGSIGIRFPDNDFYNTFGPLVQRLVNAPKIKVPAGVTLKMHLLELINSRVLHFYIAHQLPLNESPKDYSAHYEKYLKLKSVDQIYLGEDEINAYIKACKGWDNHEFFYCVEGGSASSI